LSFDCANYRPIGERTKAALARKAQGCDWAIGETPVKLEPWDGAFSLETRAREAFQFRSVADGMAAE
jgi:hypothetical protein